MIAVVSASSPEQLLPPRAATESAAAGATELEFRRLYDEASRPLLCYLRRSVGSDAVADDLMQESFYRFVRSGFRGESDEHRRRFLFKTASNLVIDHYRRNRHQTSELPENLPAARNGGGPEVRSDLESTMRRLKPRQRQLLWLAHVEGFSHREIGEVLEVKEDSIRPMLFRARRRLAELLRLRGLGPEVLS